MKLSTLANFHVMLVGMTNVVCTHIRELQPSPRGVLICICAFRNLNLSQVDKRYFIVVKTQIPHVITYYHLDKLFGHLGIGLLE